MRHALGLVFFLFAFVASCGNAEDVVEADDRQRVEVPVPSDESIEAEAFESTGVEGTSQSTEVADPTKPAEPTESADPIEPIEFSAMAWNIWRGGREDGEEIGVRKTIEVIRESGADLIAMQETYGSGEIISEALGFHFAPRGTNVSIHSRFPILEDVSVFEEFKCVGAVVELPNGQPLVFYSIWLPYAYEIWAVGTRIGRPEEELLAACQPSAVDLAKIVKLIDEKLAGTKYADSPRIIAGDFNSMSHLDYTEGTRGQFDNYLIDWPTSHVITDAGYTDAYRTVNPIVDRMHDRTWTPRFPDQQQDRIDFVYFRGKGMTPLASQVLESHIEGFPSDHAALTARFRLDG